MDDEQYDEGDDVAEQLPRSLNNRVSTLLQVKEDSDESNLKESFLPQSDSSKFNHDEIFRQEVALMRAVNLPFRSHFKQKEMRCLALVAHNHMKPAMHEFIESHSEILKKFRLTGTNTTMTMCKKIFGANNPEVVYGPKFTSGPLGGDAQLCALMCLEDVGGIIFFMDPLSAHPHSADIESLVRLSNVHNILLASNPTSGVAQMYMLREALNTGKIGMMPSFFETLESPSVASYKAAQARALKGAMKEGKSRRNLMTTKVLR
uniref:MGS-like domain-containing protein n=1 Tax=Eucampia antarctica TaxID=49252 RepID=A0A7S2RYT0_9STRA|mmetsp:Transcript_28621/g.27521  ORF Transcript_28621/g.27521 Transcript_28621/m.27521 type:complete len:262 (+) Transcript_28621:231-1016(+)